MTPEHAKQMLNIQHNNDIERLRQHALWLLEQNVALSKRSCEPDNYRVEIWQWHREEWAEIASGTKDYCIGYAEATDNFETRLQVVCGDWVVYPEEWYGLSGKLSVKEKEQNVKD